MSEITLYQAQKKKMQGLCDEHKLTFRFFKDIYPIRLMVSPLASVEAQMSMLENVEEVGYRDPGSSMTWTFEDGQLTTTVSGGTFTISKTLRSKIESILLKMISFWQQHFFREVIEKDALRSGMMPVINEDDTEDLPDGAESIEEFTDEDGEGDDGDGGGNGDEADDDELLERAAAIVRAENKATVALLQRQLNIGYARAARLLDELEEQGVVGPYNGPGSREVLPADEPDDESEG